MKTLALLSSFFLLSTSPSSAQLHINGTIVDEANQGIAYVSIGIPGTTFGTVSTKTGWFELDVDESVIGSELCFYRMSYATQCIPIQANAEFTITLKQEPLHLPEVTVTPRGSRLRWDRNPPRRFNPGGYSFHLTNNGTQIAQIIPIRQSGWIEAISVNTIVHTYDSVRVRVSFHEVVDGGIGPQIPFTERMMTILNGKQQTVLQLEESSLYRSDDVIIRFEFLESIPAASGHIIMLPSLKNETTTWHRSHGFTEWDVLPTFNFAIGVGIRRD